MLARCYSVAGLSAWSHFGSLLFLSGLILPGWVGALASALSWIACDGSQGLCVVFWLEAPLWGSFYTMPSLGVVVGKGMDGLKSHLPLCLRSGLVWLCVVGSCLLMLSSLRHLQLSAEQDSVHGHLEHALRSLSSGSSVPCSCGMYLCGHLQARDWNREDMCRVCLRGFGGVGGGRKIYAGQT